MVLASAVLVRTASAVPPTFEPDPTSEHGTITFYDAAGAVVTSGDASALVPWIAANGTAPTLFNGSVTIVGAVPEPGQLPSNYNSAAMSATRTYPVPGAPGPLAGSPDPVLQTQAGEQTFAQLENQFPHPAADNGTQFQGLYQIRILTNGSGGTDTQWWVADVVLTGSGCANAVAPCTWTQTYPAPTGVSSTNLTVTPPSPEPLGTTETLTAAITPSGLTGTVQFLDGTIDIGAPVAVSGGQASLSTTSLTVGSHSLTAIFTPGSAAASGSRSNVVPYVVNASGTPLAVSTTSLPAGMFGVAYSTTLMATGGVGTYSWSVTAGSLPPALSLNASSGLISGTPTVSGTVTFTVQVSDSSTPTPQTAPKMLSILINPPTPPPTIVTTSLPAGVVGVAYVATMTANAGTPPYTWSIPTGALPGGLTLNHSTGVISGTPAVAGTANFAAKVTDASLPTPQTSASQSLSILIAAAPQRAAIITNALPGGVVGTPYTGRVVAAGGAGPYAYTVVIGALPPGLHLDATTGEIGGTPTTEGSFTMTFGVTDSTTPAPEHDARDLTISIDPAGPPPVVATAALPDGIVGTSYLATLAASGGRPPYAWSIQSGSVPAGLTLDASGTISGTPTAVGTSVFTVMVADATSPAPETGSQTFGITVRTTAEMGVSLSSSALSFGSQAVGIRSKPRAVTLTNQAASSLNVTSVTVATADQGSDFAVSGDTCSGGTVAPGDSCTFDVSFQPGAEGPRTAHVAVMDSAPGGAQTVSLEGRGVKVVGYWMSSPSGTVFPLGGAHDLGSAGSLALRQPVVGLAARPDGDGYWEVAADGGLFAFGNAGFLGSMGGKHLNSPIVGMAATPDGGGYWEVAKDGGVFALGDAGFFGSGGTLAQRQGVSAIAPAL